MREYTNPPLALAPPVGGLADAVFRHAQEDPLYVALGRKDETGRWRDVTCAEFRDEVLALAKGLLARGVRFGDRVAIMSRTRYEWTLFDFALWTIGAQVVPLYPTSSAEQCFWTLYDSEVSAAVVEHEDHAMTIATVIDRLPQLRHLWQLDTGAVQDLYEAGAPLDDEVVHRHRQAVTPDSVATIIYTSGTTGRPKGCVITHGNFMFEAETMRVGWEPVFHSKKGDQASTLLFLPLAHVLGRMVEVAAILGKVKFGHQPQLSAAALLPDLAAFRPTFILAVPYIFEKVFNAARRKAEKEGRSGPFEKAVEIAVKYADAVEAKAWGTGPGPSVGLRMQHQLFDRLVYVKLRAAMGGRIRNAMTGGSGMDRRLGLFFAGAGVQIYEGYGLTESTAAATANPPQHTRYGTVGPPIPGVTVHIADDGEIWLHGDSIFQGYLNNPKATDQTLHDGWLATGDIGSLDEDGYLTITGRKKEILVTSGGKSVSPSQLEERVRDHPLVNQCIVVGNDRPYVAALVTLDREAVEHWLQMRGKPALPSAQLVRDSDLETEVRRAVVAANTLVSQAESIRTFRILAQPFTEEHGLLTPSLKLKRKAIENAYANEVEALYRA
ncbi:long-chain fatty acid--CoA ligase [Streptomyces sp. TRM68367]|uniref:AMP-dependent synthetase/ligase n=1 Tax=Streptomyces sp. TRM68367 TaxID=2758415 RepID=UPI00165CDAFA|nr:AMP-dependent synthetase/ligase [Streptomyces sp. TRM68367]MBC9728336.1 long-chain fatty acid--CoA ligase [Streptomyces sp. TRM68367]